MMYTMKQKKMLREIKSMMSIEQVENRHDYIFGACFCLAKAGHKAYQLNYPSLSSQFDKEDLIFYERELVKRKERLKMLQELDEIVMRNRGVIE